jgi:hypothetical protein
LGDAKPGEFSHSVRCDAVSACRALRIRSSRSLPAGSFLASSLRRRAWFASLSSNGVWTWQPSITHPPDLGLQINPKPWTRFPSGTGRNPSQLEAGEALKSGPPAP